MTLGTGVIRTPDQRLRVFVSSTLRELAPERHAIRGVIERLALAPVMFELGARPHPPRSLYRAYLEQSDIFVGIYWESYGWVAPDEEVSGLEDEYNLAPDVPMLIYIKRSEDRQPRLDALLDRIRDDDRVAYAAFDGPADLARLVTADLATLLAEHFDEARRKRGVAADLPPNPGHSELVSPRAPLTRLIGREGELQRCIDLLTRDGCRLVTLTGPGGIGKSRLAIATAREVEASFPGGVAFVDLAPIRDPALVLSSIATALGIRDAGGIPMRVRVAQALDHRRVLLVLDNVEQVVDAASDLSALLAETAAAMLATSRALLRIEGEQTVTLAPLPTTSAVELFVERAQGVKPDFVLSDTNRDDIAALTRALDNVPLAVELAAARIRVLPPAVMARRLEHALPLLVGGARDHPERQRSLRATIDWSADLLTDAERDLLLRLGVFRSAFALDAVEWMSEDSSGASAVDLLGALVDSSLVQEQVGGSSASFTMLATVREYACDELARSGELRGCLQRHAAFYLDLAARAELELVSSGQAAWLARLRDEFEDIRAAVEHFLQSGHADSAARLIWPLYFFWWSSGRVNDVLGWISGIEEAPYELDERTRAVARFYRESTRAWAQPDPTRVSNVEELLDDFGEDRDNLAEMLLRMTIAKLQLMQTPPKLDEADLQLQRAREIAERSRSQFLLAVALLFQGQAAIVRGALREATALLSASLDAAKQTGDVLCQSGALYHLGWAEIVAENAIAARDLFVRQLLIASSVAFEEGLALGLEGLFAVSAISGEVHRAGRFLGAAEDLRARRGIAGPSVFSYHQRLLEQLEATPEAAAFNAGRQEGRDAAVDAILEEALT